VNYFCPNHDNPNQTNAICLWHDCKFFHLSEYLFLKAGNIILLICNQNSYPSSYTIRIYYQMESNTIDNARKAFACLNLLRIEFCYAVSLHPTNSFSIALTTFSTQISNSFLISAVSAAHHIANRKA
jgi:hypothetical protein